MHWRRCLAYAWQHTLNEVKEASVTTCVIFGKMEYRRYFDMAGLYSNAHVWSGMWSNNCVCMNDVVHHCSLTRRRHVAHFGNSIIQSVLDRWNVYMGTTDRWGTSGHGCCEFHFVCSGTRSVQPWTNSFQLLSITFFSGGGMSIYRKYAPAM